MSCLTLSIITPSFNQGRFIKRTIDSVLSQGVKLEYRVFDGGSHDETVSILRQYADYLSFVSEPDHGQAHAVNKGLQQAQGDIIGWLNSDDIYYPGVLKKIIDYFEMHPEVDLVYGDAFHIDENDAIIEKYPTEPFNQDRLKSNCYLSQPAVFFRRQVIERFGMLDETLNFCMDYEFWLRIAFAGGRMAYIPEVLAGSRLHAATKTLSLPLKAHNEALAMLHHKFGCVSADWLVTYAITLAKQKKELPKYSARFILTVLGISFHSAIYWNGYINGIKTYLLMIKKLFNRRGGPVCPPGQVTHDNQTPQTHSL